MTHGEINAWILIAGALIRLGKDGGAIIGELLRQDGRTEAEINAVLFKLQEEVIRRRAVSAAIAFGA